MVFYVTFCGSMNVNKEIIKVYQYLEELAASIFRVYAV
jgi:hypothetical protein